MVLDAQFAASFAKFEFRTEWSLVGDQLPNTVDFACVFDAQLKCLFICDEDVADVHLSDRELRLWTLTLARQV